MQKVLIIFFLSCVFCRSAYLFGQIYYLLAFLLSFLLVCRLACVLVFLLTSLCAEQLVNFF